MYFAILQRWEGDPTYTLLFEAEPDKKKECERTLVRLIEEAKANKTPVKYKMVELEGQMQRTAMHSDPDKKKLVISQGTFRGLEFYLEKDTEEEK